MRSNKLPKIIDRKIRVGLVGCGRISKNHFDAISRLSNNLELVAVCDTELSALKNATSKHKVAGYENISAMFEKEKLDLVTLCSPSGLHANQAILAAKNGINVISEKPMTVKYQDGFNMVKACDEAKVRLFVVKQNRLNSTLQLLKRAVDEKRFGQIKMMHLNVFWTRPQDYYDQGSGWRGTWELDGGAFMNQACHYVDLVEWLNGPVESIQAMMSTTRNIETEDTGVLNIKWRNGTLGSMAVTMLTYPKNLEGSVTILGERGTVRIGGMAINRIEAWEFSDKKDYDEEIEVSNYETDSVYGFGHLKYYDNVIDVFRGRAEPSTDGREGLQLVELLTACYRAARDQTTVSLPLTF
jgi:UDP-N-acetyl-2-amino-2-deoxyglucuronate dehydrogenase